MLTAEQTFKNIDLLGKIGLRQRQPSLIADTNIAAHEACPLIGDEISFPSEIPLRTAHRLITFEPIARKIFGSFVIESRANCPLEADALFKEFNNLAYAEKLSNCMNGRSPFAAIRFGGGHKAYVSVNNDQQSGLVKIDFYEPPEGQDENVSNYFPSSSRFQLEYCADHVAAHIYEYCGLRKSISETSNTIIKLKYFDPEIQNDRALS